MAQRKKFGIHALTTELDEKDRQLASSATGATTDKPGAATRKKVSSPINSPAVTGSGKRIQRLYLDLPISHKSVECDLMELTPSECVASPLNKRVQSLLSADNAAVQQLMQAMREEGQRDPVLVRPLAEPNSQHRYEVIYGTRRRFVADLLNQSEEGGYKLKAWVSDQISDVDAKRLADSENDDREAISAWERAIYFVGLKAASPEKSTELIAELEQVDRSLVARYLQLADLPEEYVRLVTSPSGITLRAGLDIQKVLKSLTQSARAALLNTLEEGGRFESGTELLKAMKQQLKPKTAKVTAKQKREITDTTGKRRAVIGAHRTNKGQFKIDLFDVTDKQLAEIQKVLEKTLGG
ncbi:MAG: ParB/RepB/Spo0J family partition protein [Pseudomonadota bacterium]